MPSAWGYSGCLRHARESTWKDYWSIIHSKGVYADRMKLKRLETGVKLRYYISALLGLLTSQVMVGTPVPKLIREINLNQIIREPKGLLPSNHAVANLVFSPDENRIAIVVGVHHKAGQGKSDLHGVSHLIVIPLKGSLTPPLQ